MRFASFVVVILAGCGGGDSKGEPAPFTVASYNLGLAVGFVPGTESRLPLAAEAVGALDADVVCVQEVWLPDQVAAVEAAAGDAFPHRYFPAARQSDDGSCAPGDLDALLTCIEDSCQAACADDVPTCVFDSCGVQFLLLPKSCMRCAMANVGEDPAAVAESCVSEPVEFAYGGSFGTGILSKFPLEGIEEHVFASTSNSRGVTHASFDPGDGEAVDLYCTHLTAVFDDIPYPRDAGGWEEEQAVQAEELVSFVDATGGARRVVAGDLNSGPGIEDLGIVAEAPIPYTELVDAGFDAPYLELDGRCTWCADNPINALLGETTDRIINHVFAQGLRGTAATRILDGTVSAESCSVDLSTSSLSDHYGLSVTLEGEPPPE